MTEARGALLMAGAVGVLGAAAALSHVVATPTLSPDATEYVSIAQALAHGRGLVDPIQWNYYLDARVPLPALAVRAPAVPLLLSVPLGLGATLETLRVLHALWASALVGALVLLARGWLSLPGAVLTALLILSLQAWRWVAAIPLTGGDLIQLARECSRDGRPAIEEAAIRDQLVRFAIEERAMKRF